MSIKKFIGDRAFYRMVLAVSVPIMIQQGVTNFVNLLDNVMVGSIGDEAMSGVSIVNQFVFIFNLMVFGAISAAGIFTAQYHGLGDTEGVRNTFRLKLIINVLASLAGIAIFAALDDQLISLFLHMGETGAGYDAANTALSFAEWEVQEQFRLAETLAAGKTYLWASLWGMVPYAVAQVYASTMRETGETQKPMIASVSAVVTNLVLNYILIYGKLGFPAIGVTGAAVATVISRFVELGILVVWGHTHPQKYSFLVGALRSLRVPHSLVRRVAVKGMPLMANEVLWAIAVVLRNQCYSTRGLDVVAAQSICSTIFNVFSVVYMALGSSIAIVVGGLLGAGKLEEAKDTDRKMMAFSVVCALGMGVLLVGVSWLFPLAYDASDGERRLATYMIIVSALSMPFAAFANSSYFTLRSGGRVGITFVFDSVYMWVIVMPVCYLLSRYTGMNIYYMFPICQGTEIFKAALGLALLLRGSWVKQLVGDGEKKEA